MSEPPTNSGLLKNSSNELTVTNGSPTNTDAWSTKEIDSEGPLDPVDCRRSGMWLAAGSRPFLGFDRLHMARQWVLSAPGSAGSVRLVDVRAPMAPEPENSGSIPAQPPRSALVRHCRGRIALRGSRAQLPAGIAPTSGNRIGGALGGRRAAGTASLDLSL